MAWEGIKVTILQGWFTVDSEGKWIKDNIPCSNHLQLAAED